jgi:hypothetical protein
MRHPLMDVDVEESYSIQPASLDALAELPVPEGTQLEGLLARMVVINPRNPERTASAQPPTVKPGMVGLDAAQFERKLMDVLGALRRDPKFDPNSQASKDQLGDLATLFDMRPQDTRTVLRSQIGENKLRDELLTSVVNTVVGHGVHGQGFAADVLAQPKLTEDNYAAALAGLGTQDELAEPGRNALTKVLRGEMTTVPADIASNAPLLVGHQGRMAREAQEAQGTDTDAEAWYQLLVTELAKAKQPERQEMLLTGLGNIGDPRLLTLVEPYMVSPHASVRLAAVGALRRVESPLALERIFTAFVSDPTVEVRQELTELFSSLEPVEVVVARAAAAMQMQTDPVTRKRTLLVLANRTRSREFVSLFLADPEPSIQTIAKEMLTQL